MILSMPAVAGKVVIALPPAPSSIWVQPVAPLTTLMHTSSGTKVYLMVNVDAVFVRVTAPPHVLETAAPETGSVVGIALAVIRLASMEASV